MKRIPIILILILTLTGCAEIDSCAFDTSGDWNITICDNYTISEDTSLPSGNSSDTITEETEECISYLKVFMPVNQTEKESIGYNLTYEIYKESDVCGNIEYYYRIPNGTITHLYNRDGYLIGAFLSESCQEIFKMFEGINMACWNHSDKVVFEPPKVNP